MELYNAKQTNNVEKQYKKWNPTDVATNTDHQTIEQYVIQYISRLNET